MTALLLCVFGYLAGSCPAGFLVSKFIAKKDIRTFGSGNIGATNVGRLLGKKWAVATALFDMFKGGVAVFAAAAFTDAPDWALALTGVCAVLGHNFPLWLGFKGGKGVATTFGVIGFYDFFMPLPALLGGAVWYVVMRFTKYVSVASIAGLFAAAVFTFLFGMPLPYIAASFALAFLSLWRHRSNIARLRAGTEAKVGS
ncbi:MAG: glycerol-3-phosphate 1-O-acyltransferase PlsY [Synergistes sp.]|nr:glycerol-3-phosphate 1-O-acyltransferase PlsY [Synergistes sp.]MCR5336065.1 glycerol-3-phosphate 1-O-acyltransferase PlsY [Synergistes sp.]